MRCGSSSDGPALVDFSASLGNPNSFIMYGIISLLVILLLASFPFFISSSVIFASLSWFTNMKSPQFRAMELSPSRYLHHSDVRTCDKIGHDCLVNLEIVPFSGLDWNYRRIPVLREEKDSIERDLRSCLRQEHQSPLDVGGAGDCEEPSLVYRVVDRRRRA